MSSEIQLLPTHAAIIRSSMSFQHVMVLAIVASVVFVLVRTLGALQLDSVGMYVSLSVATLLAALILQIFMTAPYVLGDWQPIGFFSAMLAISVATAVRAYTSLYGLALFPNAMSAA